MEIYKYSNKNFTQNLNYLLSSKNLTKNQLEKNIGIGEGTLSRYCKKGENATEPKIGTIIKIAKTFSVSIDDLINGNVEELIIKDRDHRAILFCEKLIEQTKNTKSYEWFKLDPDDYAHDKRDDGSYRFIDWEEYEFKSKFTHDSYDLEYISMYTTKSNNDKHIKVVIVKYPDTEEYSNRYELYLIESDGEVLPSCATHIKAMDSNEFSYNKKIQHVLTELYRVASNYRQEWAYDNFFK